MVLFALHSVLAQTKVPRVAGEDKPEYQRRLPHDHTDTGDVGICWARLRSSSKSTVLK